MYYFQPQLHEFKIKKVGDLNKPFHSQSVKATYNGEAYDPRTGDIYLRARYYNTHTGTFTQSIYCLFPTSEP